MPKKRAPYTVDMKALFFNGDGTVENIKEKGRVLTNFLELTKKTTN